MDKELASGNIGEVGKYVVSFKGGFLLVNANVSLPPGESASLQVSVDSDKVLDAIAAAVPGKLDDALIALIKIGLKS